MTASADFQKMASGYGLTTAQVFYPYPDYPDILTFLVWQEYDLFPHFPELNRYLANWRRDVIVPVHSVKVAHCKLIKPAELKAIGSEFRLH